jgi:hypothetical protein
MGIVDLVDQSAIAALERARLLQQRLQALERACQGQPHAAESSGWGERQVRECSADLHRLVGDIASLRNAAELLKRHDSGTSRAA